ncbi:unnamed protein product [Strongylus vulgaris]|uniref:Uncharacterized protein n=1 Tax=Strongylus vulgaris TaxID=40348 RepID=A0A3P7IY78_STRVU|nr:unnamed protein product [Strongylus vulgaris]
MPNLVPKLGSSKITVRKISIQAIQAFLRLKPDALGSVLKTLSSFLLTSTDRATKGEVVKEFPAMFIPEVSPYFGNQLSRFVARALQLAQWDWSTLLDALTKLMATSETELAEGAALAAKKLDGKLCLEYATKR